jgi:putative DNA primase/helicase
MNIKCTPIARRLFAEYLGSVDVEERVTIVHRTGWFEIGSARAFALPGDIAVGGTEERVMLAKDVVGAYARRGTLDDWKKTVGALANDHRLFRFYTTAALAGALLHVGGFESGCFHLFGLSSMGKTTCLRMAASVWGSGADGGYVRTWRSTANGLEAALAGANDTCLPLDEVGQADGRELGQALYMTAGGVGKQRMRRDASLKPSHVWRVLALSTGEQPIETKLNEDAKRGARAHAGQLVRAIDIRVHRTHGVFDCLELGEVSPKAFADQCKSAASAHYGTAGPEFVRQLIAHNISEKDVRERVDAFVRDALQNTKGYHGQAARVAERFALISAAGEYGAQFGILPWEQSDAFNDAMELFKAWLETRGGGAPYEARQAVAQVRHFIEAHGDSRFEKLVSLKDDDRRTCADLRDPDARSPLNRAGYRKGEGAEERWLIFPEVWTKEVCAGLDPSQVAATLASRGMLEPDGEGNPSKSVKVSGKSHRFYVVTPLIFEGWIDPSVQDESDHVG